MPETARGRCTNPECRLAETGKCVEGLSLSDCPHIGRGAAGLTEVGESEPEETSPTGVALPSAERLEASAAASVLRAAESRVLAILGPSDSGKTSLIASLYDLFQRGPVHGIAFAGSLTLHAFEQACHDARASSMRIAPSIDRTPIAGIAFYHLCLGGEDLELLVNLLLGDRAGEEYRALGDDPLLGLDYVELARADSISILVDGERLIDSGARHNVRSETIMTLQALADAEIVRSTQGLALVLTKFDIIATSPARARAEADFDALFNGVRDLFGNVLPSIAKFRTAASPKSTILPRGFGIDDLLRFWIAEPVAHTQNVAPLPIPKRAFGLLSLLDS